MSSTNFWFVIEENKVRSSISACRDVFTLVEFLADRWKLELLRELLTLFTSIACVGDGKEKSQEENTCGLQTRSRGWVSKGRKSCAAQSWHTTAQEHGHSGGSQRGRTEHIAACEGCKKHDGARYSFKAEGATVE